MVTKTKSSSGGQTRMEKIGRTMSRASLASDATDDPDAAERQPLDSLGSRWEGTGGKDQIPVLLEMFGDAVSEDSLTRSMFGMVATLGLLDGPAPDDRSRRTALLEMYMDDIGLFSLPLSAHAHMCVVFMCLLLYYW